MTKIAKKKTGRCLCGAVSFTAHDVKLEIDACHCDMCRRWGGGPHFGGTVGRIDWQGEENIERYDSSDWAARGFCKQCGSHLYFHLKPLDSYSPLLGVYDDISDFVLTEEIFIDEKPSLYSFEGDHPRLTGAEVIEKFKEAFQG